jgi:sulfoxide reductase heme-binding subunit YedZ
MLHRAIYISAICGVIHYYWLVKSAVLRPLTYAAIVAVLLLWRLGDWLIRRGRAIRTAAKTERAAASG